MVTRVRKRGQYDPNSPRAVRFCEEYLVDLKPGPAAVRAGYSARRAKETACTLLTLPDVQVRIQALMDMRSTRVAITADVVLGELLRLATVDIARAYSEDGSLLPIHAIPEDVRRAIAGIEVDELFEGRGESRRKTGHTRKVKFWDKRGSLELLGKHLKLFTDVVKHEGLDKLADAMRAAEERVANAR